MIKFVSDTKTSIGFHHVPRHHRPFGHHRPWSFWGTYRPSWLFGFPLGYWGMPFATVLTVSLISKAIAANNHMEFARLMKQSPISMQDAVALRNEALSVGNQKMADEMQYYINQMSSRFISSAARHERYMENHKRSKKTDKKYAEEHRVKKKDKDYSMKHRSVSRTYKRNREYIESSRKYLEKHKMSKKTDKKYTEEHRRRKKEDPGYLESHKRMKKIK